MHYEVRAKSGGHINPLTLLPPSEMAAHLLGLLASGEINEAMAGTFSNVAIAFALSVVVGFAVGVVIHALPRLRRVCDPLLASYYSVPAFVFYPLLVSLLGLNRWPLVAIGFMFGVTAMVMTTGLTLIIGTFFRFVARRLDTRPEDYEDAEIADGAGELGFYAPHSWWPVLIALAASAAAVGVALWLPWLIVTGVVLVLSSAAGLVFEYYVGPEKH